MSDLRICLFGKFHLHHGVQDVNKLDTHRTEELLCYLLLHRREQHAREVLADLFCQHCRTLQSKKNLRQLLWRLNSILGIDTVLEQCPLLLVDPDWVQINPEYDFWLDVDVFERAWLLVEDQSGEELTTEQAHALRGAVDVYRGDLLAGWYEDWCLNERERLQNMYLGMLDKLMGYCEVHQQYDSGVAYGERVLQVDRTRERTYQRLMRLHFRAGARGAALHQFERCVLALQQELGVKPSKRTTLLFEQIRSDQLPHAAGAYQESQQDDGAVSELVARLDRFELKLNEIHALFRSDPCSDQSALSSDA